MLQAAQAEGYGGQVLPRFDEAFANALPENVTEAEITQAMEALVFSLNALPPRHGGRLPLATLQVGTSTSEKGRAVTRALLQAIEHGLGRGEVALRPHLVFKLREGVNLAEGDPNADLLAQAAQVAAKRPGITFVYDEPGACYGGHEMRLVDEAGRHGVGQVARVTLNLPRIALKARRDREDFYEALDASLDLAASILLHRHEALAVRQVSDFPFIMGQGLYQGAEGLKPQDEIRPALQHGQLTLGIVGLAQTLVVLSGQHHGTSPSSQAEGLTIVKRLSERCARLSSDVDLRLVLQAQAAEGVGDRFARLDRREFGLIKGVTEGASYTSGVALPDEAELAVGDRLALEAAYSPHLEGGNFHVTHMPSAPDAASVREWLRTAVAAGQRAFALDFPQVQCLGCGLASEPGDACPRCEAPLASAVPIVRRRGYMALGEA
jgi:ribonucleoside-triphosphate reductase